MRIKDSSMAVGLRLLRDEKADAMVSASTGAFIRHTLIAKRIRGIRRAALARFVNFGRGTVLIDCGANVSALGYLLDFHTWAAFTLKGFWV